LIRSDNSDRYGKGDRIYPPVKTALVKDETKAMEVAVSIGALLLKRARITRKPIINMSFGVKAIALLSRVNTSQKGY
jgi:hypothetical protein